MTYRAFRKGLGWVAVLGGCGLLLTLVVMLTVARDGAPAGMVLRVIIIAPAVLLWGIHELRSQKVVNFSPEDMDKYGREHAVTLNPEDMEKYGIEEV